MKSLSQQLNDLEQDYLKDVEERRIQKENRQPWAIPVAMISVPIGIIVVFSILSTLF